jgi:hypothetical protein
LAAGLEPDLPDDEEFDPVEPDELVEELLLVDELLLESPEPLVEPLFSVVFAAGVADSDLADSDLALPFDSARLSLR